MTPYTSDEPRTSGSTAAGTPKRAQQLVVPGSGVNVEEQRAAGVGDVGDVRCAAGEAPDQEAVDGAEAQARRARRAPAAPSTLSSSQASLVAGEIGVEHEPGLAPRTSGSSPRALSAAQTSAVRRSCQTMARCDGLARSLRSQSTVVSRWLVMPMADTHAGVDARVLERLGDRSAPPSARCPRGRAPPNRVAGRCCGNSR